MPMIARVYRNLATPTARAGAREIAIGANATFDRELDARLPVPIVIDRWPRRGPLAGMLGAFARMRSRFVFAAAGDTPSLDAAFVDALDALRIADAASASSEAFEAYVPIHGPECDAPADAAIEPLAALYDRLAFVREGLPVLRSGRGSLRAVIARLRTKYVRIDDPTLFTNINTPADYAALRARDPRGENR